MSDGRLNYALLYMETIAGSPHRDIHFAHTLLSRLDDVKLNALNTWAPRSFLEHCCLSTTSAPLPLLTAASQKWGAMTRLMVENGVDLDTEVYCVAHTLHGLNRIICWLNKLIMLFGGYVPFFRFSFFRFSTYETGSRTHKDDVHWAVKTRLGDLLLSRIMAEVPWNYHLLPRSIQQEHCSNAFELMSRLHFILEHSSDKALMPTRSGNSLLLEYFWSLRPVRRLRRDQLRGEIWRLLVERYKRRPEARQLLHRVALRPFEPFHGFVFMAARFSDPVALKAFLELGSNENGSLPIVRRFITPLDVATIHWQDDTPNDTERLRQAQCCYEMLAARPNIRNGWATRAEMQLLSSIFIWVIGICGPPLLNRVPDWLHTILIILIVFVYIPITMSLLMFLGHWQSWCLLFLPSLNLFVFYLPYVHPVIFTRALRGPAGATIRRLCNTSSPHYTNV
ncbi:hypothetical protein F4803DRAFT_557986 [Xylaria telfairii]|nr:hypothetical protein F4803DRAFT_557986 [Xylaria telfairii]